MVLCGYVLASAFLLYVSEKYLRRNVIGPNSSSGQGGSLGVQLLQKGNDLRRTQIQEHLLNQDQKNNNDDNHHPRMRTDRDEHDENWVRPAATKINSKVYPNSDRLHSCTLPGNETLHTLQAPDLVIAGAQKGGTSAFYFMLRRHPHFSPSMKVCCTQYCMNLAHATASMLSPTVQQHCSTSHFSILSALVFKQSLNRTSLIGILQCLPKISTIHPFGPNSTQRTRTNSCVPRGNNTLTKTSKLKNSSGLPSVNLPMKRLPTTCSFPKYQNSFIKYALGIPKSFSSFGTQLTVRILTL